MKNIKLSTKLIRLGRTPIHNFVHEFKQILDEPIPIRKSTKQHIAYGTDSK